MNSWVGSGNEASFSTLACNYKGTIVSCTIHRSGTEMIIQSSKKNLIYLHVHNNHWKHPVLRVSTG